MIAPNNNQHGTLYVATGSGWGPGYYIPSPSPPYHSTDSRRQGPRRLQSFDHDWYRRRL